MAGEDVTRLERQVAAVEKDLAARQDTQGGNFRITLEKKTYTERAEAGNALVYLVAGHRDDHLAGRTGTVVLGEMAGFKLEYRSTWPDKVTLRGAAEHVANVSPSPVGSISSLEHAARCIDEQAMRCREELTRCQTNVAELAALTGKIFEHEERYRELVKRQGELVDLLDITKNQAAAQQATETKDDLESVAATVPEPDAPGEEENPEEAPAVTMERVPVELMTPRQFKSAGLGPANDTAVLRAARQHKPVSALAVDEYNLTSSLPKGYVREGDRFVFKAPAERTKPGRAQVAKPPASTVRLASRAGSRTKSPSLRMSA